MAIDQNDKETYTKFNNQYTSWMKKGQNALMRRSKNREGFFFVNVPIFICEAIITIQKIARSKRMLPKWLEICSELLVTFENAGFPVAVILADRGYFEALGFAIAGNNLWNHGKGLKSPPILITPRQFAGRGGGKRSCKWEWLLGEKENASHESSMKIHTQDLHLIPNLESLLPDTQKHEGYLVRVIEVYTFESNRAHKINSWAEAHNQALRIEHRLDEKRRVYRKKLLVFRHCYRIGQHKCLKRVPQFKKGVVKAKYKNPLLSQAYLELGKAAIAYQRTMVQKTKLLNKVFVTVFSIPKNRPLTEISTLYRDLVSLYSLRWRIENAYKALKEDFFIPSATSSIINYVFHRVIAFSLWNEYQLARCQEPVKISSVPWKKAEYSNDIYGRDMFSYDKNISSQFSRTRFKLTLFENQMKNWITTIVT
jgi:hypothetical protein